MEVLVTTGMQVTGDLTADGQRTVGAGVCRNLIRDDLIGSGAGVEARNVEAVVCGVASRLMQDARVMKVETKYKDFVADPFVSIRVEGISSAEVFLVGQVTKPGAYPLSGNESVLQILTRAGGLTIFADRDEIRVVRREGAKVIEYVVDYDAILKGDLKQDILMRPGDRIIVP